MKKTLFRLFVLAMVVAIVMIIKNGFHKPAASQQSIVQSVQTKTVVVITPKKVVVNLVKNVSTQKVEKIIFHIQPQLAVSKQKQ